jgi:thiamine-monophosphate kinase
MAGEFDFIEWLRSQQPASAFVPVPAGDDLAILRWDGRDLLLVGADQVLDGVHFDASVHSPRQIGRKVMNRNLSDCAAMACLPAAALATVALPRGVGVDYARELYLGLREAADPFDCAIVGGDTGSWDGKLAFSVTILGRSAGVTPVRRCGAKPGDGIYVTGPLGGSIRGRHMTFEPRVNLARELVQAGGITAMIDLSDGLSRDLRHICRESGVGAVIDARAVPIHDDALNLPAEDGLENAGPHHRAMDHALNDGEDYELLFTGKPAALQPGIVRVGLIVEEQGLWLDDNGRRPLEARGWEHAL